MLRGHSLPTPTPSCHFLSPYILLLSIGTYSSKGQLYLLSIYLLYSGYLGICGLPLTRERLPSPQPGNSQRAKGLGEWGCSVQCFHMHTSHLVTALSCNAYHTSVSQPCVTLGQVCNHEDSPHVPTPAIIPATSLSEAVPCA